MAFLLFLVSVVSTAGCESVITENACLSEEHVEAPDVPASEKKYESSKQNKSIEEMMREIEKKRLPSSVALDVKPIYQEPKPFFKIAFFSSLVFSLAIEAYWGLRMSWEFVEHWVLQNYDAIYHLPQIDGTHLLISRILHLARADQLFYGAVFIGPMRMAVQIAGAKHDGRNAEQIGRAHV